MEALKFFLTVVLSAFLSGFVALAVWVAAVYIYAVLKLKGYVGKRR